MAEIFVPLISLFLLVTGLQAKATNQMPGLGELEATAVNQMSEELDKNLTNQNPSGRIANVQDGGSRVCCRYNVHGDSDGDGQCSSQAGQWGQ